MAYQDSGMKILVSAVACSPLEGSEGAVGWNAVLRIARKHEVRVLTHRQFESGWIEARNSGLLPDSVEVRFLGEDRPWHPNRLVARMQSWWRYLDFSKRVLPAALAWHRDDPVDLVHQVTYATWRVPSSLWRMPVPLVWGPLGGAGRIPRDFRGILSGQAKLMEAARDLQGWRAESSKAFADCVRESAVVIAANEEAELFLKRHRGDRPMLRLPVAFLSDGKIARFRRDASMPVWDGPLRLFAGGNMIGSKGLAMAVRALARVKAAGVDFRYTVAGGGPEIPKIEALVAELGLGDRVHFHPGYRGDDYIRKLHGSDIYFLPSLRETLGMTMLDAMLAGCLAVVADASAPGEIVRMAGGVAVKASTPEEMEAGLAEAVIGLDRDRIALRDRAERAGFRVAESFSQNRFDETLDRAYALAGAARKKADGEMEAAS